MAKSKANQVEAQAELATARSHVIPVTQLYKTTATIGKAIEAAKTRTTDLMNEYQKIACSVIKHVYDHSDVTVVRNLLDNFPEGFRKVAISGFIDAFAPVKFETDKATKKTVVHFSKERRDEQFKTDEQKSAMLDKALNQTWWGMKATAEKEYVVLNVPARIFALIKTGKQHLDEGGTAKGDIVSSDMLKELEAIALKYAPKKDKAIISEPVKEQVAA